MAVTHISKEEALACTVASLLDRALAGEEIVIDDGTQPVSVVLKSGWSKDPSISATLERLKASAEELGYEPVMDADFAADMEEIIRNRKPSDRSAWD